MPRILDVGHNQQLRGGIRSQDTISMDRSCEANAGRGRHLRPASCRSPPRFYKPNGFMSPASLL